MAQTTSQPDPSAPLSEHQEDWHRLPAETTMQRLGSSVDGLSTAEAARRLAEVGANELARPGKPSAIRVALSQLRDPMNLMLLAVMAVSLVIDQSSTAVIVGALVLLNVAMGPTRSSRPRPAWTRWQTSKCRRPP